MVKQNYCICYMSNMSLMHVVPPLKILQSQLAASWIKQANQTDSANGSKQEIKAVGSLLIWIELHVGSWLRLLIFYNITKVCTNIDWNCNTGSWSFAVHLNLLILLNIVAEYCIIHTLKRMYWSKEEIKSTQEWAGMEYGSLSVLFTCLLQNLVASPSPSNLMLRVGQFII